GKDGVRGAILRRALRVDLDASELIVAENFGGWVWGGGRFRGHSADCVYKCCAIGGALVIVEGSDRRAIGIALLREAVEGVILHAGAGSTRVELADQEASEGIWRGAIRVRVVSVADGARLRIGSAEQTRQGIIGKAARVEPWLSYAREIVQRIV